ncbi:L-Aspartase-like protein [Pelagophyceae sp. CCMP2097]|nr:L-Aspartase-like protein [Pelagophyceae sp. CCMP2097]|mmetsp:Transcript_4612/g.16187  ORF Transcript_4612/g.16187 Transcript_4612/m.16187 type:complete len:463 (-) Transcript_4612:116-1504(-)
MAEDFALDACCPLDGRYYSRTAPLRTYFSEAALIKYRVRVEVEYLIQLASGLDQLAAVFPDEATKEKWRRVYVDFSADDAKRCKAIEKVTNHDVKAVEYFLKEKYDELGLAPQGKEFIHFGLTSQDVNHVAQPLMLAEFSEKALLPKLRELQRELEKRAWLWRAVPMLARTHGQAATPTVLGKEFAVFASRLKACVDAVEAVEHGAKFGGATGLMNAHRVAYPGVDWATFADKFVADVSGGALHRQRHTTQIEHYDQLAAYCHAVCRAHTAALDLCRDCWQYISLGYFKQKIVAGEVGSSAMPHKVNPIDFENAEGNFGLANAILGHLAEKLPVSRLQRDLSDSTALRSLGVALGHSYVALGSALKGLGKLQLDEDALRADLDQNWAVVAEALQTILRRENFPKPYEALKELTRTGGAITEESIQTFICGLDVSPAVKAELAQISPHNYIGVFDASEFEPKA